MTVVSVTLSSGQQMPLIGLGTWQSKPEEVELAVETALTAGYRHIDTAYNYNNEDAIGRALKRWLSDEDHHREDLFIATKLPHIGNRASDVVKFLDKSLERLQLEYVDLYMVHMPFGFLPDQSGESPAIQQDGSFALDMNTDHITVWKALEEQVVMGKVRAIGVSNFNLTQLERLMKEAVILPAVNQVELHAYLQQPELRTYCQQHGITVTAYSPLGSPGSKMHFQKKYNYSPETFPDLLGHSVVLKIAEAHRKTPAQILLRHLVQQKIAVIPKSTNPTRINENIQVFDFELSKNELDQLNRLDQDEKGRIIDFMFFKGVDKHPEYPFTKRLQ